MPRRSTKLSELDPIDESDAITVVIETTRGARTKLAYDDRREAFVVRKILPQGMSFPFDFGFIPSTLAEDGDPLDVLVLMDEAVPVGAIRLSISLSVITSRLARPSSRRAMAGKRHAHCSTKDIDSSKGSDDARAAR